MKVTDSLRIRQNDSLNVVLEQYTTGVNPKTKEQTSSWKIIGYYKNARSALKAIVDRDLLINLDECENVKQYRNLFENEVKKINELLEVGL